MRGTFGRYWTPVAALRITLLTEIPAPFRIPLFNALAREPGVELNVLFLSRQDPKRPYPVYADEFRFGWRILNGLGVAPRGRWIVVNRGVLRAIRSSRPSMIVVGGWNQPAFWAAAIYARAARVPLVGWVESTARDERPYRWATELPKKLLARSCAAFLVPGRASADYLRSLGVEDNRIELAPNAVDTQVFGSAVMDARGDLDRLRSELGITGCTFLYVGRLDPEKGVDLLIEAMRSVAADLVVVGAGADGERLKQLAPANVRFVGRLERDTLVPWYAAADAFVLPSRSDQWGMVLSEAATAGLPLVSTDAPGAAHDLIEDGVNGFRVPTGDMHALTLALSRLAESPELRKVAGRRSAEIAARFTPEAWAGAVSSAGRRLVA
jgi:glycosyltransferase involved in cell wall biosynthesis